MNINEIIKEKDEIIVHYGEIVERLEQDISNLREKIASLKESLNNQKHENRELKKKYNRVIVSDKFYRKLIKIQELLENLPKEFEG